MIAVDIETAPGEGFENFADAALDFHRCKITVIATWSKDGGKAFTNIQDYNEWYEAQGRPNIVGHNFKFDLKPLKRLGAILPNHWEDTSLMAVSLSKKIPQAWLDAYEQKRMELNKGTRRAVHRRAGGYSLKTLAPYFLGVQAFWEVEDHANVEYALKDAQYTYLLYFKLKEMLEEESSIDFYTSKILPWAQMLVNSEYEGITLDLPLMETKKKEAEIKAKEAEEKLHSMWADAYAQYREKELNELSKEYAQKMNVAIGKLKDKTKADQTIARYSNLFNKAKEKVPYRMNIASPTQLTWLFKNYLKIDITDFNGDESTGKPVLQRLAGQGREDIQTFLEFRKYTKLCKAFFPSYEEMQVKGRLHTNFNITGTRTGRLSSSGPNLQQCPGDLHDLFIAEKDKSLLCYDLAGIEPVMIAYITEDPIICDLLISGKNFHTHNTKVFFGIQADDDEIKAKFKKERDLAKEVGLALLYGAGPRRLQESAMKRGFNWSIGECKKKHEAFKEEYQYIYKYKKNLDSQLEDGGMIRNVLGRPVKIEDPENVYMTGFNTLIQSSASDMLIHSVYKATKTAPKSFKPLLFVHDEIIAEVDDHEAKEAESNLLKALEGQKLQTSYGLIPVNAEGGIFKYWKK